MLFDGNRISMIGVSQRGALAIQTTNPDAPPLERKPLVRFEIPSVSIKKRDPKDAKYRSFIQKPGSSLCGIGILTEFFLAIGATTSFEELVRTMDFVRDYFPTYEELWNRLVRKSLNLC